MLKLNFSKSYLYFVLARVVGLLVKPLFLMFLLKNGMENDAAILSKVFLLLGGVFVVYHVPVHFEYYKLYFEEAHSFVGLRRVFYNYIKYLTCHVYLVIPVVFVISYVIVNDLFFALLMTFYLLTEKLFDEIQRFFQFTKDFTSWSNIFLLKTIVPVFVSLIYIEFGFKHSIVFFIIVTIMSIMVILLKNIHIGLLIYIIKKIVFKIQLRDFVQYLALLKRKYFSKFLQGISTSNILNIDKWLAAIFYSKSLLSELTLMSQISNSIAVGMNYATIANRRSDLMKSTNTLSSLMLGWKVPFIAFTLFLIVIGLVLNVHFISGNLKEFSVNMVIFLVLSYTVYAISEPLTEYLFWNAPMKTLLRLDGMYFGFMVISGLILYMNGNYSQIPVYFLIAHLFRCSIQILLVYKMEKHAK